MQVSNVNGNRLSVKLGTMSVDVKKSDIVPGQSGVSDSQTKDFPSKSKSRRKRAQSSTGGQFLLILLSQLQRSCPEQDYVSHIYLEMLCGNDFSLLDEGHWNSGLRSRRHWMPARAKQDTYLDDITFVWILDSDSRQEAYAEETALPKCNVSFANLSMLSFAARSRGFTNI